MFKDSRLRQAWISRTVVGIVLATFFSDFSHEMATAILPLYLSAIGLGPAALGIIEGFADFLVSLSKLAGGVAGNHLQHKRPWASRVNGPRDKRQQVGRLLKSSLFLA